ncbi:MAG: hypothetical protein ABW022_18520 [Actinoplanes sp.]
MTDCRPARAGRVAVIALVTGVALVAVAIVVRLRHVRDANEIDTSR